MCETWENETWQLQKYKLTSSRMHFISAASLPRQAKRIFFFRPLFFELSTSQNFSSSGSAVRNASDDTFPWLQVLCFVHTQRGVNTIRRKKCTRKSENTSGFQALYIIYTIYTIYKIAKTAKRRNFLRERSTWRSSNNGGNSSQNKLKFGKPTSGHTNRPRIGRELEQ